MESTQAANGFTTSNTSIEIPGSLKDINDEFKALRNYLQQSMIPLSSRALLEGYTSDPKAAESKMTTLQDSMKRTDILFSGLTQAIEYQFPELPQAKRVVLFLPYWILYLFFGYKIKSYGKYKDRDRYKGDLNKLREEWKVIQNAQNIILSEAMKLRSNLIATGKLKLLTADAVYQKLLTDEIELKKDLDTYKMIEPHVAHGGHLKTAESLCLKWMDVEKIPSSITESFFETGSLLNSKKKVIDDQKKVIEDRVTMEVELSLYA